MIYCALEQRLFPDEEFRDDSRYGKVHKALPEHTTLGEYITTGTGGLPLPPADPSLQADPHLRPDE